MLQYSCWGSSSQLQTNSQPASVSAPVPDAAPVLAVADEVDVDELSPPFELDDAPAA